MLTFDWTIKNSTQNIVRFVLVISHAILPKLTSPISMCILAYQLKMRAPKQPFLLTFDPFILYKKRMDLYTQLAKAEKIYAHIILPTVICRVS